MIVTDAALEQASLHRMLPGQWADRAACANTNDPWFEPVTGREPTSPELAARTDVAREFCAGCPVIVQCGFWADEVKEFGVWGGALRFVADAQRGTYALGGRYVAVALIPEIPEAPRSRHDIRIVTRLVAEKKKEQRRG